MDYNIRSYISFYQAIADHRIYKRLYPFVLSVISYGSCATRNTLIKFILSGESNG
ncbi:MAG: hypothetical protein RMZ42_05785 [Nostoc sp. DedQUE05]|nr:hypothetical protein [Nostoc sp. DedQUE05]